MCEIILAIAALEPPADGHVPTLAMVSSRPGVYKRLPRRVWAKWPYTPTTGALLRNHRNVINTP